MPEIVASTTFYVGKDDQWYWRTRALNGKTVADGSEGYANQQDAVTGFFVSQGLNWGKTPETWPANYSPLTQTNANEFTINKYT